MAKFSLMVALTTLCLAGARACSPAQVQGIYTQLYQYPMANANDCQMKCAANPPCQVLMNLKTNQKAIFHEIMAIFSSLTTTPTVNCVVSATTHPTCWWMHHLSLALVLQQDQFITARSMLLPPYPNLVLIYVRNSVW